MRDITIPFEDHNNEEQIQDIGSESLNSPIEEENGNKMTTEKAWSMFSSGLTSLKAGASEGFTRVKDIGTVGFVKVKDETTHLVSRVSILL